MKHRVSLIAMLALVAGNGGPMFKFTEAVSFLVRCDTQQEVDEYWSKLSAAGGESQCGWLKDKFGLSWQIVPARLSELIKHPKAMQAMLRMKKLDIGELERAAAASNSRLGLRVGPDPNCHIFQVTGRNQVAGSLGRKGSLFWDAADS